MLKERASVDLVAMPEAARTATWIALVTASSVLFSLALACATPFAAVATIAGTKMSRRSALVMVGTAWLVNQAIGYLILGYPRTWDSFAWGATIGVAAGLATIAIHGIAQLPGQPIVRIVASFIASFVIYEVMLFVATTVLPSGDGAFSLPIVGRMFGINIVAFIGLLAIHRGAVAVGLLARTPASQLALARA